MDRWLWRGGCLSLVLMAATVMGCDRSAAEEGAKGNLEFYYHPADGSTQFDRPMAMGSSMKLYVDAIQGDLDSVVDAYAEPESVLRAQVDSQEELSIALRARSPGDARVHVDARKGGVPVSDFVSLQVDRVRQVEMEHRCTSDRDAAYMAGQPIEIKMERQNGSGQKLVGQAQAMDGQTEDPNDHETACQVWLYPEYYQGQARCDEAGLHIEPVDQLEGISVEPIDGVSPSGSHDFLGVHVVEEEDIEFTGVDASLREGSIRSVELEAIAAYPAQMELCGGLELDIEILTPNRCEGVLGRGTDFSLDADDDNSFRLRGLNPGQCEFSVRFTERPELPAWYFDLWVEPEED